MNVDNLLTPEVGPKSKLAKRAYFLPNHPVAIQVTNHGIAHRNLAFPLH
jgi:hypothetical protein